MTRVAIAVLALALVPTGPESHEYGYIGRKFFASKMWRRRRADRSSRLT